MTQVPIEDALAERARQAAADEGFPTFEEYVAFLLRQGVKRTNRKSFRTLTGPIRAKMEAAGLTEEQVLEDFERFRNALTAQ